MKGGFGRGAPRGGSSRGGIESQFGSMSMNGGAPPAAASGFGAQGASSGFGGGSSSGFGGAATNAGGTSNGFGGGSGGGDSRPPPFNEGEGSGMERPAEPVTYVPREMKVDDLFNQHINAGINFMRYGDLEVQLTGIDVAEKNAMLAINTFDKLELPRQVLDNVHRMGYMTPTPIQKVALPIIMQGKKDLMACAQTGSGKTAAFLLPMLDYVIKQRSQQAPDWINMGSPFAIVIAPTRELAVQICNEAKKFAHATGVGCVEVYGGVAVRYQATNIRRGSDIVVGTPGRLLDFVGKGWIKLNNLRFLVLDEADRMLDMGFAPEFERLVAMDGMPPKEARTTLMFSATFPPDIQQLARQNMKEHVFTSIGRVGGANEDVVQEVWEVADRFAKKKMCVDLLHKDMLNARDQTTGLWTKKTLVFVEGKKDADFLGSFMSQEQIPSTTVHGSRLQEQREEALSQFRSGKFPIMIATNVAARGLDIQGVDHVIQVDLPRQIEDYVHRIGRTGRVGNPGRATALFDMQKDQGLAPDVVKVMKDAQQIVPEFLLNMVGEGGGASSGGWNAGADFDGFGGVASSDGFKQNQVEDNDDWA